MSWERVHENRQALDALGRFRPWISPALLGLHRRLLPLIQESAHGKLIDAGCGTKPYQSYVLNQVTAYDGLDLDGQSADLRYVSSIMSMDDVRTESYDIALCTEVLEHVSDPSAALRELSRVLRVGGWLILSAPHMSRLHDEPFDYFRYTRHGLRSLIEDAGFQIIQIRTTGSIFSFMGHQVSSLILGTTWHVPILRYLAFALNFLVVVIPARVLDLLASPIQEKIPLGYVVQARKIGDI